MSYDVKDTKGFEFRYNLAGFPANARVYEGATGTTYTRGTLATMGANGLIASAATTLDDAKATPIVGVIAETKETTDDDKMISIFDNPLNVYEVSVAGHTDKTVTRSTSDNTIAVDNMGSSTASGLAGTLIHIYDGPGKGQTRTILSNTTSNSTGDTITISGKWDQRPTSASKAVVLTAYSTSASVKGINIGARAELNTTKKLHVVPTAYTNGYLNVLKVHPEKLTAEVVISASDSIFGPSIASS